MQNLFHCTAATKYLLLQVISSQQKIIWDDLILFDKYFVIRLLLNKQIQLLNARTRSLNVDIERQNSHFSASTANTGDFQYYTPEASSKQTNGYNTPLGVGCRTVPIRLDDNFNAFSTNGGHDGDNLSSVRFSSVERFDFISSCWEGTV